MADKATQETRRAREEAQGNIDRVRTLLKEGNTEAAAELTQETEALFPKLSTTAQREMRKALKEAQDTAPDSPGADVVLFSTVDYRAALREAGEDPDAVVTSAAESLQDTIEAVGRAATKYLAFAEFMFTQYSRFTHKGTPDIMANSQAARDFASAMQADARKRLEATGLDQAEAKRQVDSAWKDYKKRMRDYRAQYAAELDRDPESFREQYPMLAEEYPDASPAEALSLHYKLDLIGYSERQRRYARIATLKGRFDGASEVERVKIKKEIHDIQVSMGTAPEQQKALDPAVATRKVFKSVGTALTELDPEIIRELPEKDRRAYTEVLPTHIARLSAALTAAQEGAKGDEEK